MKSLIKLILILLTILYASSCKNYYLQKYCKPSIIIKDSIVHDTFVKNVEIIKTKDSIVYKQVLIPSSSEATLKNPCDSLGKLKDGTLYYITNQFYKLKLKVKDGELIVEQKNDSIVNLISSVKEKSDSVSFLKQKMAQLFENIESIDNTQHLTTWQKIKVSRMFDISIIILVLGIIIFKIYKLFK